MSLQRRYESEVRSSCNRFLREDRSWVAALSGVWNWRGTSEAGGKVAPPEWESVALNGRKVYVVFDSDVMEKREVYEALRRLRELLQYRGADVCG